MLIEEFVFCQVAIGVFNQLGFLPKFLVPPGHFSVPGPAFSEVGVHYRMYNQGQATVFMGDKVAQVLFNLVLQQQGRGNLTCTIATGT